LAVVPASAQDLYNASSAVVVVVVVCCFLLSCTDFIMYKKQQQEHEEHEERHSCYTFQTRITARIGCRQMGHTCP